LYPCFLPDELLTFFFEEGLLFLSSCDTVLAVLLKNQGVNLLSQINKPEQENNLSEPAFVDASGKYIDASDYSSLKFRLPALDIMLQTMIEKGESRRLIVPQTYGVGDVFIERIDPTGAAWKIWQQKTSNNGTKTYYPAIRFFYDPKKGTIRPIDYRDKMVHLEGRSKTTQLLIASFMAYWFTTLMAISHLCSKGSKDEKE